MTTFEGEEVLLMIVLVADIAESPFPLIAGNCLPVNEILVEAFPQQPFVGLAPFTCVAACPAKQGHHRVILLLQYQILFIFHF